MRSLCLPCRARSAPIPKQANLYVAGFGRYGPYVQHDGKYASLSAPEEVFEVGINRAVSLLAEKAASRSPRGASVIKELGDHPDLGGKVQVLSGRYGPYVKHGKINATIPKDIAPEETTLARAVELIAARSAKGPAMKGSARKPAKASKTAAKKSPSKAAKAAAEAINETVEETAG